MESIPESEEDWTLRRLRGMAKRLTFEQTDLDWKRRPIFRQFPAKRQQPKVDDQQSGFASVASRTMSVGTGRGSGSGRIHQQRHQLNARSLRDPDLQGDRRYNELPPSISEAGGSEQGGNSFSGAGEVDGGHKYVIDSLEDALIARIQGDLKNQIDSQTQYYHKVAHANKLEKENSASQDGYSPIMGMENRQFVQWLPSLEKTYRHKLSVNLDSQMSMAKTIGGGGGGGFRSHASNASSSGTVAGGVAGRSSTSTTTPGAPAAAQPLPAGHLRRGRGVDHLSRGSHIKKRSNPAIIQPQPIVPPATEPAEARADDPVLWRQNRRPNGKKFGDRYGCFEMRDVVKEEPPVQRMFGVEDRLDRFLETEAGIADIVGNFRERPRFRQIPRNCFAYNTMVAKLRGEDEYLDRM
eukprot:g5042.t1